MNLRTLKKVLNPALILTFLRPILIIQTVVYIEDRQWFLGLLTTVIAAGTDIADGYVARQLKCQTKLGAFLDPIFDKIMLLLLFYFMPIFTIIILALEIGSIIASALLRRYLHRHYTSPISKHITAWQMGLIALLILLAGYSINDGWLINIIGVFFVLLSYTRVAIYIQGLQEKEYLKASL